MDITHFDANTTPLPYNQTKRLTGRPNENIAWATTLLAHPDILTKYEDGLQETEDELQQSNQVQKPPNNTARKQTLPSKNKDQMPAMARPNAELIETPLPVAPGGNADISQEQIPNPATWQPTTTHDKEDTAPKDPTRTHLRI